MHFKSLDSEDDLPAFEIGMSNNGNKPPILDLSDDDSDIEVIPEEPTPPPPRTKQRSMPFFDNTTKILDTLALKPRKSNSPVNCNGGDDDAIIRLKSPVDKALVNLNPVAKPAPTPVSVLRVQTSDNIPTVKVISDKTLKPPRIVTNGTRIKLQDLQKDDVNHILDPDVSKWVLSAISMVNLFRDSKRQFAKRGIFIDINEFFRDFIPDKLQYLDDSNCAEIVEALSNQYYQRKFGEMVNVVKARDVKRTARKSCTYDYLIPNRLKARPHSVVLKRANVSASSILRVRSNSTKSDKRKLARVEKRRRLASPAHSEKGRNEKVRKPSERQRKRVPQTETPPMASSGATTTCPTARQNSEMTADIAMTTADDGNSIYITLPQDTRSASTITVPREPITIVSTSIVTETPLPNAAAASSAPAPAVSTPSAPVSQTPSKQPPTIVNKKQLVATAEKRKSAERTPAPTSVDKRPTTENPSEKRRSAEKQPAATTAEKRQTMQPAAATTEKRLSAEGTPSTAGTPATAASPTSLPVPEQRPHPPASPAPTLSVSGSSRPSSTTSSPKILPTTSSKNKNKKFECGVIWIKPEPKDHDEVTVKCKHANCGNPALTDKTLCLNHQNKETMIRLRDELLAQKQRVQTTPLPPVVPPPIPVITTVNGAHVQPGTAVLGTLDANLADITLRKILESYTTLMAVHVPQFSSVGEFSFSTGTIAGLQSADVQQINRGKTMLKNNCDLQELLRVRSLNCPLSEIHLYITTVVLHDKMRTKIQENMPNNKEECLRLQNLVKKFDSQLSIYKLLNLLFNCVYTKEFLPISSVLDAIEVVMLKEKHDKIRVMSLLETIYGLVPIVAVPELRTYVVNNFKSLIVIENILDKRLSQLSYHDISVIAYELARHKYTFQEYKQPDVNDLRKYGVTGEFFEITRQVAEFAAKCLKSRIDRSERQVSHGELLDVIRKYIERLIPHRNGRGMPTQPTPPAAPRGMATPPAVPVTQPSSRHPGSKPPSSHPGPAPLRPHTPPTLPTSTAAQQGPPQNYQAIPVSQDQMYLLQQHRQAAQQQQHPQQHPQQGGHMQVDPRFPQTVMVQPGHTQPQHVQQPGSVPMTTQAATTQQQRYPVVTQPLPPYNPQPHLRIEQPRMRTFQQRVHNNIQAQRQQPQQSNLVPVVTRPQQTQQIPIINIPHHPTQQQQQQQPHLAPRPPQQGHPVAAGHPGTAGHPVTTAPNINVQDATNQAQWPNPVQQQPGLIPQHVRQNLIRQQQLQLAQQQLMQQQQQRMRVVYPPDGPQQQQIPVQQRQQIPVQQQQPVPVQQQTASKRRTGNLSNVQVPITSPTLPVSSPVLPQQQQQVVTQQPVPPQQQQGPPPPPPQQQVPPEVPPQQQGTESPVFVNVPGQETPMQLPPATGNRKYYTIQEPGKPDRYELLTEEDAKGLEKRLLQDHERKKHAVEHRKEAPATQTMPATNPASKNSSPSKTSIPVVADKSNDKIDVICIDDEDNTVTSTTEHSPGVPPPAPVNSTLLNDVTSADSALCNGVEEPPVDTKTVLKPQESSTTLDTSLLSVDPDALADKSIDDIIDHMGQLSKLDTSNDNVNNELKRKDQEIRLRKEELLALLRAQDVEQELSKRRLEDCASTSAYIRKRNEEFMELCTKKKNAVQPPPKKQCMGKDEITIIENVNLPTPSTESLRIQRGRLGHISDVVKTALRDVSST